MPEGEIFIERRKHKRVPKKLKVFYRLMTEEEIESNMNERTKKEVESSDISITGIQLLCDEKIDAEKILRLDVFAGEDEPIATFAETRWVKYDDKVKKYRVGMEFLVIKEEHINIIKKITGE
jgi:c-di-GMP-binding flagellar brake protein YcgR